METQLMTNNNSHLDLTPQTDQIAGSPSIIDPVIVDKAEKNVLSLLNFTHSDIDSQENSKRAVEVLGLDLQRRAANESSMLKAPMKTLASKSDDGGSVANALIDLKMQVETLDPNRYDLSAGWFSRMMGFLPFIGTPVKKYFTRFESAQTIIDAIIHSLEEGRDQLERDNKMLEQDKKKLRMMSLKLEQVIQMAQLMDEKISYKLERDIQDEEKKSFVQEQILFPLRQRIMDLQQQHAVNQQGVLAFEVIISNNKELIKGVNRSINVTVSALEVAVTVAMALENQKIVLDKVTALQKTTNNLIAGTAKRLKTQGVEIQKQASSSALDMDTLKTAFADINSAMNDIATYRREALPKMKETISEMDKLTLEADKSIKKIEQGKVAQSNMALLEE